MKRAIVTGASGFIGRYAVAGLLDRGFDVHALGRSGDEPVGGAIWHRIDLLRDAEVETTIERIKGSHLLHLAWSATPPSYWTTPENLMWVRSSLHLFSCFHRAGGTRAVGVGTCAEYEWSHGICIEDVTPTQPSTLYGVSKDCTQRMLRAFSKAAGLSSAWARVFHTYGPGEHVARLVPSVILGLLAGRPVPCTAGNQIRDYLHVADVASALVALLESDVSGPVNLGSGRPLVLRELVSGITTLTGCGELIQFGARPLPASEPAVLLPSVERLSHEVKWTPKFDLDQGLRDTVAWWRQKAGRDPQGA